MTDWRTFLARRGVQLRKLRPLSGGVINETWLVNDHEYVLRRYRRTRADDELLFELSAIQFLAEHEFPTAAVVPATDGKLFDRVEGGLPHFSNTCMACSVEHASTSAGPWMSPPE